MRSIPFVAVATLLVGSSPALAQDPQEAYLGDRELQNPDDLTQETLDALASNRPSGPASKPVMVGEKAIRFVYGTDLPTVVCAPFRACDIQLQSGEQIIGAPILPDRRWKVSPGISGRVGSGSEVHHVVVTPQDVGLETTLIVHTDRRTYHLQLAARRKEYVASVSFSYPEDHAKQWATFQRRYHRPDTSGAKEPSRRNEPPSRRRSTSPSLNLGALSFDYELEGDEPAWRPTRIYNDAEHTVIEFPRGVQSTGLPSFMAIRHEGVFEDEPQPFNYRVHKDRGRTKIVVDGVPNIMHLVEGVGSSQTKVVIRRTAGED